MSKPTNPSEIYNIVIGTAGHIDHGKSSLVKRLTGIDPDRLPEEQERGMTIDLGFAPFTLKNGQKVGMIDVPGHERFVKNMVAGATGIDLVMLIVAADDGIMPQTREHLSIMTLLGMQRGLVVINKIDLVDKDMQELVREEIKDLVQGTFLEGKPIVPVSAATGAGFDQLTEVLNQLILETPPKEVEGFFRMPIQRVFAAKGFGTIITGVPLTGRAKIGDALEILPLGRKGRIRGFQAYKSDITEIRAGHSSAINVADIDHAQVCRGFMAATPGVFKAVRFVDARLRAMPDVAKPLRNRMPVKLHVGTAEANGRLVLLDKKQLDPGEDGYAQFRLEEPLVVSENDPFIVRLQSPMVTLGGGRILDIWESRPKRIKEDYLVRLSEKEEALRDRLSWIEFAVRDLGSSFVKIDEVARAAKIPRPILEPAIARFRSEGKLIFATSGAFIHQKAFERTLERIVGHVEIFHRENPLRSGMDKLVLRQESRLNDELFARVLDAAVQNKKLIVENEKVRKYGQEIKLSRDDGEAAVEVETLLRETRFQTPRREEITARFPKYNAERIDRVLGLLVDRGAVVSLKEGVLFHKDTVTEAARVITEAIQRQGAIEAAQFRDLVGTTRKYIIPLLEHLDDIGVTVRVENKRVLKPSVKQGARDPSK